MQTLGQIRQMVARAGLTLQKRLGQCFLIDHNLMRKLLDLADVPTDAMVLEVGAGTATLTEELLSRARHVVAVEIDRGVCELARRRLGPREDLTLIHGDALAGKHALSPAVVSAVGDEAHLVANLPYSIATPVVAECLLSSYRAAIRPGPTQACRFDRLTFTVQKEVADRLASGPGSGTYGSVSVLTALLGHLRTGVMLPASAFWPRPKVASRMIRIDFDPSWAARIADIDVLRHVLATVFTHRRKQIGWAVRHPPGPHTSQQWASALEAGRIDRRLRPQRVAPDQYLAMANALAADP